ncbi:MAG: helix-turn-helix transcriptional regulator [Planctomycetota bacterium]
MSTHDRDSSKGGTANNMSLRFGKALKIIRLRSRMTQKQIADSIPESLGVSQSYLSRVENGGLFPGKERLNAICHALDCSVSHAWSIAESLDIQGAGPSNNLDNQDQLLSCLGHEKLGLEFEDVSAVQGYVESRMQSLSQALDRLHVAVVTDKHVDQRDIDTLKSVAQEIVLPAKAAQSIIDLLSVLIDCSETVTCSSAEEWNP